MSNETEAAPAGSNSPVRPSASCALRVWPAVLLVVLMIVARFGPAFLEGGLAKYWMFAMMGPMVCCLLLVIWWLAASRATWKERVFGFLGIIAVFAIALALVEPLMRGPGTIYITLPMGMSAFVVSNVFSKTTATRANQRGLASGRRRIRILRSASQQRHEWRIPAHFALALGTHGGRTNARRENHEFSRPRAKYAFHRNESRAHESRVARLSRRRSFG